MFLYHNVLHIYIIYNIDMIIVWGPTDYAIKDKYI